MTPSRLSTAISTSVIAFFWPIPVEQGNKIWGKERVPATFSEANDPARPGSSPSAGRIQRLQAEARNLAREQIAALEAKLAEASILADEIAQGGDAYPVGVREIDRGLADQNPRTARNLGIIMSRA